MQDTDPSRALDGALAWARRRFQRRRFRRGSAAGFGLVAASVLFVAFFFSMNTGTLLVGAGLGLVFALIVACSLARILPIPHEAVVWLADRAFDLDDRLMTSLDTTLNSGRFQTILEEEIETGLKAGPHATGEASPVSTNPRPGRGRRFLRRWRFHLVALLVLASILFTHGLLTGRAGEERNKPEEKKNLVKEDGPPKSPRPPGLSGSSTPLPGQEGEDADRPETSPEERGKNRSGAAGKSGSRKPPPGSGPDRRKEPPMKHRKRSPDLPPSLGRPERIPVKTSPRFVLPLLDEKGRVVHKKRWTLRFLPGPESSKDIAGKPRPRPSWKERLESYRRQVEKVMDRRGIPPQDRELYLRYLDALGRE